MNNFTQNKALILGQAIENEDIDYIVKFMEADKDLDRVLRMVFKEMKRKKFAEEEILYYLSKNGKATPKKLMVELECSNATIHRNLLKLCKEKKITKIKNEVEDNRFVYYALNESGEHE